eukprot:1154475-Pelagomonas_calceolata.AAC.8
MAGLLWTKPFTMFQGNLETMGRVKERSVEASDSMHCFSAQEMVQGDRKGKSKEENGALCYLEWEEEQFQLLQAAGAEQAALQHQCEAPQTLQAVKLPGSVQEQQPHLLADLKAQELELLQKRRELEQQLQQQQQQQQQ